MTKKLVLALLPFMAITACGKSNYQLDLNVATPAGSPAVAFYKYLGDTEHLEVNSDANNVLAYFGADNQTIKDVIVAPTNAGVAKIKAGAPYKIAATVTFGNFFLLSTGKDDNEALDEGDKVLAFQENGVAGKLYKYLYGDKTSNVTYVADAKAVNTAITDKSFDYEYVLLAQPVVSAVVSAKEGYKVFANVQNDYKEKTGGKEITQASIFIRGDVDNKVASKFLNNVEKDVKELLDDPEKFLEAVKDMDDATITAKVTAKKEAVVNLIKNGNALGIGYKNALENKAAIDAFITSLGLQESNEEIYFNINK